MHTYFSRQIKQLNYVDGHLQNGAFIYLKSRKISMFNS